MTIMDKEFAMKKKSIKRRKNLISRTRTRDFVKTMFATDLHAKRIGSLADATLGILVAGSLAIHAIGHGLAMAAGLMDKHAVKQVDRLLSNINVEVELLFSSWVRTIVGSRESIIVNLDWSDFDDDDHTMLVISMQTRHGRATPLIWRTVVKSKLKHKRNDHEDEVLVLLREALDTLGRNVKVTVVADRGFCDHALFAFLRDDLKFEFIIRFRGNIYVTSASGETRSAKEWRSKGGRMTTLHDAFITAKKHPVSTIVVVQDKGMKDTWCLAVSDKAFSGTSIKKIYGKRFTCEETFRDIKDMRFGLGMKWTSITRTDRRDRMMFVASVAHLLLTLLGEAGERAGLDRVLKTNTSKKRTLSLFRQGVRWYDLIPMMPEERLRILMDAYVLVLKECKFTKEVLGVI